jgi:hypothetical protein
MCVEERAFETVAEQRAFETANTEVCGGASI